MKNWVADNYSARQTARFLLVGRSFQQSSPWCKQHSFDKAAQDPDLFPTPHLRCPHPPEKYTTQLQSWPNWPHNRFASHPPFRFPLRPADDHHARKRREISCAGRSRTPPPPSDVKEIAEILTPRPDQSHAQQKIRIPNSHTQTHVGAPDSRQLILLTRRTRLPPHPIPDQQNTGKNIPNKPEATRSDCDGQHPMEKNINASTPSPLPA